MTGFSGGRQWQVGEPIQVRDVTGDHIDATRVAALGTMQQCVRPDRTGKNVAEQAGRRPIVRGHRRIWSLVVTTAHRWAAYSIASR